MSLLRKIIAVILTLTAVGICRAELKIDVSGAMSEPIPMAIPVFSGDSNLGSQITDIVVADLERSGLFRLINRNAYIQKLPDVETRPAFADWQVLKAEALLNGAVQQLPDGKIRVSYRLWDVFAQRQMQAKSLTADPDAVRKIAHMVADAVYERITGETGYFDTQIVFVSENGPQNKRTKRLAIMDQDGENVRYLSDGKEMALTPRFAPDMKQIAYFSYKGGKPRVYVMDLTTGETALIGQFQGMSFAPRFSPDGKKLVMSLAQQGNSDIYVYDLKSKTQKRLTNHPAIDTSPSYDPTGRQIVFNSDRGGSQQLYIMDGDGEHVRRISFGEGSYATPVWSPRGDYVAFTKIKDSVFHIGIMRPDGTGERLITDGFMVEAPSWAPNGRVLSYVKQTPWDENGRKGQVRLYAIDVTGYNEHVILTPEDASGPAWSPLLH